jgi:hypothetical protein
MQVLVILDYREIPSGNILKRWEKEATFVPNSTSHYITHTNGESPDRVMKHALLMDKAVLVTYVCINIWRCKISI